MQISFGTAVMKSKANLVLLAAIALASCSSRPEQPPVMKVDKPFAAAGSIEMQVDGGDYIIRSSPDERSASRLQAIPAMPRPIWRSVASMRMWQSEILRRAILRATVEVPATADLTVHLTGGNLEVAAITGNKDIDSKAGNVEISIPNSNDYGTVDAAKVGNLNAGPFGDSDSGLSPRLKWSGPGKYTLRASLGAGNLELKH